MRARALGPSWRSMARAAPRQAWPCRAQSTLQADLQRDGAVWPVPVLSAAEAGELRKRLLAETSGLEGPRDFARNDLVYYKSHLVFSAVDVLARHPLVVQAAQQALGTKDLLLWDSSIPIKPPSAGTASDATVAQHFPWHQDGTYWGLTPADGAVSCWVALSAASREHGCMHAVVGSHNSGQLHHALKPGQPGSMLRRGQQVEGVDDDRAEAMALAPGEMSMHHPFTLHCSGPNTSSEDRIGVVLVFVTPVTVPNNDIGSATLISGQCTAAHWALSSHRPSANAGAEAATDASSLEAHAYALKLHRGELQARL